MSGCIEAVSKKIPYQVLSVAEAEHYAAGEAAKSVLHWRNLAEEISEPMTEATDINSDSSSTITMVDKTAYSTLRRHFHPRRHAIRELQRNGLITLTHVPSDYNVADIFTKTLTIEKFTTFRDVLLGVVPLAHFYSKYADKAAGTKTTP
jgi:histone deacetylase 1/2